jgi:decaprenyl-phosphate phosphoribosyltransferase
MSGGGSAAAVRTPARYRRVHAVVATLRPRQWMKNVLVIAAAGAAGALTHDDVLGRVTIAGLAFCLLASGLYAINDVHDAAEDRRHPVKRFRPVAAGEIKPGTAVALGITLIAVGIVACYAVRPLLAVVGVAYLALTLSYTMFWRRVALLDITAIAGGFVLRALAGGVAAPVTLSRWFVLVISFAALFVAAGKRRSELARSTRDGGSGRRVLALYTDRSLRLLLILSATAALFAYSMWAFQLPSIDGIPWRPLTIVPFAICLARYGAVIQAGDGEAPEEVVLKDRRLQLAGLVWLIMFALGVNAA